MIWLLALYVIAAYWTFWLSLTGDTNHPARVLLFRALLYLAVGPLIIISIYTLGYIAEHHERTLQDEARRMSD
jgi:hypothetical protein